MGGTPSTHDAREAAACAMSDRAARAACPAGGHTVDESHDPFVGDLGLFQKREEALRKRVNHRREARLRDADR